MCLCVGRGASVSEMNFRLDAVLDMSGLRYDGALASTGRSVMTIDVILFIYLFICAQNIITRLRGSIDLLATHIFDN